MTMAQPFAFYNLLLLLLTAKLTVFGKITVNLGTVFDFSCSLNTAPSNVSAVKWSRDGRPIGQIILSPQHFTISQDHKIGTKITYNTSHTIPLVYTSLQYHVKTVENESCYKCEFLTTFGIISNTSCISIYMPPIFSLHYRYMDAFLDVTCSVTAYPLPVVAITFMNEVYKQNTPIIKKNADGSQTLTLSFLFKKSSATFVGKTLTCTAQIGDHFVTHSKSIILPAFKTPDNVTYTAIVQEESWSYGVLVVVVLVIASFVVILLLFLKFIHNAI